MNSTITPANNVNFQAKLYVAEMKGNNTRWKNIAKIFEQKTKEFTNDELILSGDFGKRIFIDRKKIKEGYIEDDAILEPALTKALENLSDNEVIQHFISILKFMRNQEATQEKITALADSMNLGKVESSLSDEFYTVMCKINEKTTQDFKNKNPIFKLGLII